MIAVYVFAQKSPVASKNFAFMFSEQLVPHFSNVIPFHGSNEIALLLRSGTRYHFL